VDASEQALVNAEDRKDVSFSPPRWMYFPQGNGGLDLTPSLLKA